MFSFIIINYNTSELTSACLESIFKYCPSSSFEIILIDNNSRPDDLALLRERFSARLKIIANQKNLGFAAANNQGAELAQGQYLFFLNSDTLLKQDILTPLAAELNSNNKIGIIAPRLILENGEEQLYAYGLIKKTVELAWVSGAALVIRREIFSRLGGWDKRFFMYFEDVDICRLTRKQGYIIKRSESAEITHLGGGSPIPYWRRKFYYYRSKLLFIFKHYFKMI